MWCAASKLIHTLLSLVAVQAHDICNRLACLGLFPPFIFSFFPFFWMGCHLTLRPHVATTVVPFIVIPFMRRPHLATLRAFQAALIPLLSAACCFCCGISFFVLFITLLLLSQQYASVSASVCAPLYASMRAPLFQLGQLQIKQNTHTHKRTHTYKRNLLMNWQIIKYAKWTSPVVDWRTDKGWTGGRTDMLTKWQLSRQTQIRHHVYSNKW